MLLPILIGVAVVAYLMWKQFDPEEFNKIIWSRHTFFWITLAIVCLVIRHLANSYRLYILADQAFSFKKCIELIFIWEFSSAITPTSVGGSAVALFVLAQEKLTVAKTSTIVIFTIVLDTFFFCSTLLIYFIILGPIIIEPGFTSWGAMSLGKVFIGAYIFMACYGFLFFYGLFFKPVWIKKLIYRFARFPFINKFREKLNAVGDDIVRASKDISTKKWDYYVKSFGATFLAWSVRFLLLSFLIVALVPLAQYDFQTMFVRHSRIESMFVMLAFSPTPGGSGIAEIMFKDYLGDYAPAGIAVLIALVWRIITYYSYLLAGSIVIPNWIRKIINSKKRKSD